MKNDKKYPVVFTKSDKAILDVGLKIDDSSTGVLARGPHLDLRYGCCDSIDWINSGIYITIEEWQKVSWDHDAHPFKRARSGNDILADLGIDVRKYLSDLAVPKEEAQEDIEGLIFHREERKSAIDYLKEMQNTYVDGYGYGAHPLPEWYAIDEALNSLEKDNKIDMALTQLLEKIKEEVKSIELLAEYSRGDIKEKVIEIIDKYSHFAKEGPGVWQEWHPVYFKSDYPPEEKEVLIDTGYGRMQKAYFHYDYGAYDPVPGCEDQNETGWYDENDEPICDSVEAWMELPESYSKAREEIQKEDEEIERE